MQDFIRVANATREMWVDRRKVVLVELSKTMSSAQPDSPPRPTGWLVAYWLFGDPTRRSISFSVTEDKTLDERELEARELARLLVNAPGPDDEPF